MDFTECYICSSSVRLLYGSYLSTQSWLERIHESEGDYLTMDYLSSLSEEPYTDFTQNHLFDLATLWGQFGTSKRQKFHKTYDDISSLISVPIEEPILQASLRF